MDFTYKLELHRGLKRLLREVISNKDRDMQLKNLGKVYSWYFRKLESVGMLNNADKDEEEMLLNPGKIEQIEMAKRAKKDVARQELLKEENVLEAEKMRFDRN